MDLIDKIFGLITVGWCVFMAFFYALLMETGRNHSIKNGWFKTIIRIIYVSAGSLFIYAFFVILFA